MYRQSDVKQRPYSVGISDKLEFAMFHQKNDFREEKELKN